ncbi:transcriptional repressor GlnR [Bacillaceae bacterium]
MSDEIRRNMPLFPIGIVMKLTDLTARQIRYYEQHNLISPARTAGNQRLFSFNDVDRLLEIKSLIEKGLNIAGIKEVLESKAKQKAQGGAAEEKGEETRKELTDQELHQLLKQQIFSDRLGQTSLIRGELSRFYH